MTTTGFKDWVKSSVIYTTASTPFPYLRLQEDLECICPFCGKIMKRTIKGNLILSCDCDEQLNYSNEMRALYEKRSELAKQEKEQQDKVLQASLKHCQNYYREKLKEMENARRQADQDILQLSTVD